MRRQDNAVDRVLGYRQENVSESTLGPSCSEKGIAAVDFRME